MADMNYRSCFIEKNKERDEKNGQAYYSTI